VDDLGTVASLKNHPAWGPQLATLKGAASLSPSLEVASDLVEKLFAIQGNREHHSA